MMTSRDITSAALLVVAVAGVDCRVSVAVVVVVVVLVVSTLK